MSIFLTLLILKEMHRSFSYYSDLIFFVHVKRFNCAYIQPTYIKILFHVRRRRRRGGDIERRAFAALKEGIYVNFFI